LPMPFYPRCLKGLTLLVSLRVRFLLFSLEPLYFLCVLGWVFSWFPSHCFFSGSGGWEVVSGLEGGVGNHWGLLRPNFMGAVFLGWGSVSFFFFMGIFYRRRQSSINAVFSTEPVSPPPLLTLFLRSSTFQSFFPLFSPIPSRPQREV